MVEGAVTARRIHARAVEILVAHGDIELAGAVPIGGRWALRAPAGRARISIDRTPIALTLRAGGGIHAPAFTVAGQDSPRELTLQKPGSARLIDAQVSGRLELLAP
jgi:hypothetical protein